MTFLMVRIVCEVYTSPIRATHTLAYMVAFGVKDLWLPSKLKVNTLGNPYSLEVSFYSQFEPDICITNPGLI